MMTTKFLFFAALVAIGVASVLSYEVETSEALQDVLQNISPNESVPIYLKEISQLNLETGLNLNTTVCPCTILDSLVPDVIWLTDFLVELLGAILANFLNLLGICSTLSGLFNNIHPTPGGWNCCSDCTYCYLPNTTIFILVKIVVLGIEIIIKLHN